MSEQDTATIVTDKEELNKVTENKPDDLSQSTEIQTVKDDEKTDLVNKEFEASPEVKQMIEKHRFAIEADYVSNMKAVYDLVKRVDEKSIKKIESDFEAGVISIEAYDRAGNNKSFTIPYIPLTREKREDIDKYQRQWKTLNIDVKNKGLTLQDFQERYPEFTKDVILLEELYDEESLKIIGNNVLVDKKAQIYFNLTPDQIKMCSDKNLGILFHLYESRNNSLPYWKA